MKTIIIATLMLLTGCMTNVPCPPGLGEPGEMCVALQIPTHDDVVGDTIEAVGSAVELYQAGRAVYGEEESH